MDKAQRQRLKKKGWKAGSVKDLLALTPEESTYIEVRLALCASIRESREHRHLTQTELARVLKSSQSRVAKIESGDASVSLDMLVRALLALGATRGNLANVIGGK